MKPSVHTASELVELLPCPFCGEAVYIRKGVNGYGHCKTEGCHASRAQIVSLDDQKQVAAWNRRVQPAAAPVRGEGGAVDERLKWFLMVIEGAGGEVCSTESRHNPINVFCEDRETGDDTFNISEAAGYTQTSHDTSFDTSTTRITDKGRAYLAALATREEAPAEAGEEERLTPDEAWSDLLEKEDRTSPEDQPDMLLITAGELADYMARAQPQAREEAQPVGVVDGLIGRLNTAELDDGTPLSASWRPARSMAATWAQSSSARAWPSPKLTTAIHTASKRMKPEREEGGCGSDDQGCIHHRGHQARHHGYAEGRTASRRR